MKKQVEAIFTFFRWSKNSFISRKKSNSKDSSPSSTSIFLVCLTIKYCITTAIFMRKIRLKFPWKNSKIFYANSWWSLSHSFKCLACRCGWWTKIASTLCWRYFCFLWLLARSSFSEWRPRWCWDKWDSSPNTSKFTAIIDGRESAAMIWFLETSCHCTRRATANLWREQNSRPMNSI